MRIEDGTAFLEGNLTLATASGLLEEGAEALRSGIAAFDLSGVAQVDSSALSLMLSWQRQAVAAGTAVAFRNAPASLHSLARVYGVGELIQL